MESLGEALEQVELKYCERCGGLWLRPTGEEEVYCPECAPKMAEVTVSRRRRRPRVVVVAVNSVDEIEGCIAELLGVSTEGGNA
jgi:hypothetical protein